MRRKSYESRQFLQSLYQSEPSIALKKYLSKVQENKASLNYEDFTQGVKDFVKFANLRPNERVNFYGNRFFGLHYNDDLALLCNKIFDEKIVYHTLNNLCPPDWIYGIEEGAQTLVYQGEKPSEGLDHLIKGPTVIDCGMFCQLSIWFGIRNMIGDIKFNQLFGNTPLYLTQFNFEPIEEASKPYLGNPLHPFFKEKKGIENNNSIGVVHFENTPLYPFKHPASRANGENCVLVGQLYSMFNPLVENKIDLKREPIEEQLLNAFNMSQNINDLDKTRDYGENPESVDPTSKKRFKDLASLSKELAEKQLSESEWRESLSKDSCILYFDFEKFINWTTEMEKISIFAPEYNPLSEQKLKVSAALLEKIPFENRETMFFSNFKVETPLQSQMLSIAKKFCRDVMMGKSSCVILSGNPGIGKTASAVSCAKELESRGKKIIWISEIMVKVWTDKAKSFEEFLACKNEIQALLNENPDAVFLDDENLVGYAGKILLEECYSWYACHPGKALFITSNEMVSFKKCYGPKLDETFHFSPFPGYTSDAYQNTKVISGIKGKSLRAVLGDNSAALTDAEKLTALLQCRLEKSVGIIISQESFLSAEFNLNNMEYIPSIENLNKISESLASTRNLGPEYETLNDHQKAWLKSYPIFKKIYSQHDEAPELTDEIEYEGITIRKFEKTQFSVIAIEISIDNNYSLPQFLRVINYAHDQGNKKVIIINRTNSNPAELLIKIKEEINSKERERSMARIEALLSPPELTVNIKSSLTLAELVANIEAGYKINEKNGESGTNYSKNPSTLLTEFWAPKKSSSNSSSPYFSLDGFKHIK